MAQEYELVPVSPIEKLKKEIERLKKEKVEYEIPLEELKKNIERLSEQISKLVTINLNLQAKMTELMIKMTDLIKNEDEMIELLRKASEIEVSAEREIKVDLTPLTKELKELSETNKKLVEGLKLLENYLKKAYTKELISKAVKAAGGEI